MIRKKEDRVPLDRLFAEHRQHRVMNLVQMSRFERLRLSILLWIDRLVCFAELAHDPVFDPLAAPPIDRCDSGTVQERREVQVVATR